jgi:hypothetical protein
MRGCAFQLVRYTLQDLHTDRSLGFRSFAASLADAKVNVVP